MMRLGTLLIVGVGLGIMGAVLPLWTYVGIVLFVIGWTAYCSPSPP